MPKWARAFFAILVWGGVFGALAFVSLTGRGGEARPAQDAPTTPTISLDADTASPDDIVRMRIDIPPGRDGQEFPVNWTYGYLAGFQEFDGATWKRIYTLYLGMKGWDHVGVGYSEKRPQAVLLIGFVGDSEVKIQVPPVEPGTYRVTMRFGRHQAYDTIEVV